ncbi:MAG TPA: SPOR domain-containing protein [Candidatus Cloacimonadota bacterium]|nr:SPOR domain-containing protein [Candidatus Cloacimonadota bacterium]HPK40298.1 SPOR domain-containing protein [Candidatus Cloacimonadota bacterium]
MNRKIIALLFCFSLFSFIFGATIQEIENAYQKGTLQLNSNLLLVNANDANNLSACKLFYTAKIHTNITSSKSIYNQAYTKGKQTKYGQMAYLELAKMDFFERKFDATLVKLKDLDELNERFYWQARTYFLQNKYLQTIVCVENYLDIEPNGEFALELNALLLDVYLKQNKPSEFLSVKQRMEKLKNYPDIEAYTLYKEGLLYEQANDLVKAMQCMKTLSQKYPKSQYRVYADDLVLTYNKKIQSQDNAKTYDDTQVVSQPVVPKASDKGTLSVASLEKGKPYIQYGLFSTKVAADNYQKQLDTRGIKAFVITKIVNNKEHFAVIQGPFTSRESANSFLTDVKNNNISAFLFFP